jgi:4-fold beta-flower domain-containing protein
MSETTLYDTRGTPRAYIATDGVTIYLWDGEAVAYLVEDKVYAWTGRHIGWFVQGILFDESGRRCGYVRARCPVATRVSPVKSVKRVRRVKSVRQVARTRRAFSAGASGWELRKFLAQ